MSPPAVFRMELGEPLPTLATLLRLSHALGLEMLVSPTPAERATAEPACDLRQPRVQVRVVTTRGATMTIAIR